MPPTLTNAFLDVMGSMSDSSLCLTEHDDRQIPVSQAINFGNTIRYYGYVTNFLLSKH
jgi:hypothetical protein